MAGSSSSSSTASSSSSALFVPLEDLATEADPRGPGVRGRFLPTELARGPWDEGALHGGPVAALLAEAAEALLTGPASEGRGPKQTPTDARPADGSVTPAVVVTRLSVELLRPVPLAPLELWARVVRPGRRVQLVDTALEVGGRPVAWGRILGLRTRAAGEVVGQAAGQDSPDPGRGAGTTSRLAPPEAGTPRALRAAEYRGFHSAGAEVRFVDGAFDEPGPATAWVRLAVPVVPDRPPSPLQRAAAAADFGNGLSAVLPFENWRFVNPDLTVVLARPPVGEWVAVEARTDLGVPGTALARSILHDEQGPFGSAAQCLVVEPR
ncbi:thioesterase family protein [Aciditerrimonas ferrireducens]|uniref:thioesterase family protein n=1 Tax=Aciditerrimonas ferrireducens TaxID=667306 RepID=UPI002005A03A|nr:thioesterase family protein [Aciditerrimonas ferrireducens]MCK4178121.1 thioesterase family protein [Aciditerrimonas ferrireducens]